MYLDYSIKNSTLASYHSLGSGLGQWEAAIPAATNIFSKIFGGGKSEAQKKAESVSRRKGRAKNIVDAIPTLNQLPSLKARLYSYLANCMPEDTAPCHCEPLANYIANNFPLEVGQEVMRISPTVMEKKRGYTFITSWQKCLAPKLSRMKSLSKLQSPVVTPPVSAPPIVTGTIAPPIVTGTIAPLPPGEAKSWWERLLERTATPSVLAPTPPIIVTPSSAIVSPSSAPVIQAGVGKIDPQTLLIVGGVGLGAILLSQGKKRR